MIRSMRRAELVPKTAKVLALAFLRLTDSGCFGGSGLNSFPALFDALDSSSSLSSFFLLIFC